MTEPKERIYLDDVPVEIQDLIYNEQQYKVTELLMKQQGIGRLAAAKQTMKLVKRLRSLRREETAKKEATAKKERKAPPSEYQSSAVRVLPSMGTDEITIDYGPRTPGHRITTALIASFFGTVFIGSTVYLSIRDWDQLFERPIGFENVRVAVTFLAGIVFCFIFGGIILWNLFGSKCFTASRQGLTIKKTFLGIPTQKHIPHHDIKEFVVRRKTHAKTGIADGGYAFGGATYYQLWVTGGKRVRLIWNTYRIEDPEWVGQTLAEWFGVSYDKRSRL